MTVGQVTGCLAGHAVTASYVGLSWGSCESFWLHPPLDSGVRQQELACRDLYLCEVSEDAAAVPCCSAKPQARSWLCVKRPADHVAA